MRFIFRSERVKEKLCNTDKLMRIFHGNKIIVILSVCIFRGESCKCICLEVVITTVEKCDLLRKT